MATITFRVDDDLKQEASELYKNMGLDLSSALKLFMRQSVLTHSIPFTIKADDLYMVIDDSIKGVNMSREFSDVKSLMEDLNA